MKDKKQVKSKKIMPPPWLAYPKIERYSIGWRMGYGEDYIVQFWKWWKTLLREEQEEYRNLFPEPVTWNGWWNKEDTCEVLTHGEFCIPLWRQSGEPKYTRARLEQEIAYGKQYDFCLFWGHRPSKDGSITQSCLSQWWMEQFWSVAHNYCCMEQFMMEQKAELFGDKEIRQQILESRLPDQIKSLGRKVRGFDQALWDQAKYPIVLNGNWCKFSQNRRLRDFCSPRATAFWWRPAPTMQFGESSFPQTPRMPGIPLSGMDRICWALRLWRCGTSFAGSGKMSPCVTGAWWRNKAGGCRTLKKGG